MLKTFSQLAPQWYEELKIPLKYRRKTKNPKLNIGDTRYCIVGEIYGFSDNYALLGDNNYCLDCHFVSGKIATKLILTHDNPLIPELINHINKAHPELMEGKKC